MSRTSDAFRWLNLLAILLSIGVGCTLCAAGVIRAMARCTACISSGIALFIAGLGVVALEIVGYSELVLFYRQWHGKGALFIVLAAFVLSDAVLELAFAIGIASVGVLFVVFRFVLSDPEPLLGSKHMYFYDRSDPNAKPYVPATLRRNQQRREASGSAGQEIFVERVPKSEASKIKAQRLASLSNAK